VQEFRPGGDSTGNLKTTELVSPTVTVLSSGNSLPTPVVIGTGGRIPPNQVIEDDASGSVETSGVFDPATDGIDFYESREGMRVQVNNAVAVGPTNACGETPIIGDDGANALVRTARGGILLRPEDGNPERLVADDAIVSMPKVNVGDHYSGPIVGVLDYNFGNFFLEVTQSVGRIDNGLQREIDPANDQDGGEPGGNIRQVFLFRTDRGLSFVDRPGATATTPTGVTGSGASTQLTLSPGRIDPTNPNGAWTSSRKPLVGEF